MHPQPRPFNLQLFLDFCSIVWLERPLNFFVIMIHQVIWPSPNTLGIPSSGPFLEETKQTKVFEKSKGGYRDSARLLGESYWPKKWGAARVKMTKRKENRELDTSWAVGGVGAHGLLMLSANVRRLAIQYKRSKCAFVITSYCIYCCTHLYRFVTAPRVVSNRESRYPRPQ